MNAEESVEIMSSQRKRKDSVGGNSDSDLSDGWNVIDHLDVPSSDGESVEVIGTDEESVENGRNMVVDLPCPPERGAAPVTRPPPATVGVIPTEERQAALREEMFDSSFCWFLFFAAGTVLVSNLTFMAAENFFTWDVGFPTESPSFLRDLPTTPKQVEQVESLFRISQADNEEADVETVEDSKTGITADEKRGEFNNPEHKISAYKTSKGFNVKEKSMFLPIDSNNVVEYLKLLSDVAGTPQQAKEKLDQALLILDALQIGLNDLEDGVSEHAELRETLTSQRNKITNVINEIHSGVLRSMGKMANNVLNKVHKLEKKFENQWCKLEKNGYKEEFSGLFYDCHNNKGRRNKKQKTDINRKNKNQETHRQKDPIDLNSYQFEVDKDSTGKAYSIPKSKSGEINEYYNLVNKENYQNKMKYDESEKYNEKRKYPTERTKNEKVKFNSQEDIKCDDVNIKRETKGEFKRLHKNEHQREKKSEQNDIFLEEKNYKKEDFNDETYNYYDKYLKNNDVNIFKDKEFKKKKENFEKHDVKSELKIHKQKHKKCENSKFVEDKSEHKNRFDMSNEYHYKNQRYNDDDNKYVSREEKLNDNKSKKVNKNDRPNEAEHHYKHNEPASKVVSKFLSEKCGKKSYGDVKLYNDYLKIKESIDKHIRIPKNVFDSLYNKYCNTNSDNAYRNEKFNKNDHKEQESNNEDKFFSKNIIVIESPDSYFKTVMDMRVVETAEEDSENVGPSNEDNDKVILPQRKGVQQWVFSYEEPTSNNKTNLKGDWFIKAGQSRSKARWSHSRGDWWFDRATHRRRYSSPPSWLSDRHKNWQFLRAWARQRCRHRPQDGWCSFPPKEHIPNENSNFR